MLTARNVLVKILFVHNYYGSSAPSGENKVFEAEKAMLEKHGHEVAVYTRHSDEIRNGNVIARLLGKIKGALCTIGNPFAARAMARKCREFKPDIVHFHNTFPLISPLAVKSASKYAPVVMTLHNYRTACVSGVPTRDGKVCSLCLDKKHIGAVVVSEAPVGRVVLPSDAFLFGVRQQVVHPACCKDNLA